MPTDLSIQLSDVAFTSLASAASAAGTTPAELAAAVVEQNYARHPVGERDAETARAQFEQLFGSVDLGRPIGLANDAIDADLARSYGSTAGSD